VEKLGGEVVGIGFLIELSFLKGREKLGKYPIYTLVDYTSE
jgi:adenine phosphoribosyltransferase